MASKNYVKVLLSRGWGVLEQPTNQVITIYPKDNGRRAKHTANYLNGGNGFNGHTPPFFLEAIL